MTLQELNNKVAHIEGFMGSKKQRMFFYNLGKRGFDKAAEIGSYKGLSAALVALGSLDCNNLSCKGEYFCIDTFEASNTELPDECTLEVFKDNIDSIWMTEEGDAPASDFIHSVVGYSFQVYDQFEDNSLDFVYVDGAHDPDSVALDVLLYWPKVKTGGLMILHDFTWETVQKGVDHGFKGVKDAVLIFNTDDFGVFMKTEDHRDMAIAKATIKEMCHERI